MNDNFDALMKRSFAEAPEPADDGFAVNVGHAVARRERTLKLRSYFQYGALTLGAAAVSYGLYSFVAFRLGNNGEEVRHVAPPVNRVRDRQWRVASKPALAKAPTLQLQYRPERFVLLAQGPRPYTLVAGSVRAAREDYPVQAALAASNTPPQPATLGEGSEAGGAAAMAPKRGEDWQRWVLWAVLALGACLVLLVSLRVLRQPKPE